MLQGMKIRVWILSLHRAATDVRDGMPWLGTLRSQEKRWARALPAAAQQGGTHLPGVPGGQPGWSAPGIPFSPPREQGAFLQETHLGWSLRQRVWFPGMACGHGVQAGVAQLLSLSLQWTLRSLVAPAAVARLLWMRTADIYMLCLCFPQDSVLVKKQKLY